DYVSGYERLWEPVDSIAGGAEDADVFNISPDARSLLLPYEPNYQHGLTLWNASTLRIYDDNSIEHGQTIAEDGVAGAAFIPGDTSHILILNAEGIVKYDLYTRASEIVNAALNSSQVRRAVFSPDAQNVAIYLSDESGLCVMSVQSDSPS